MSKNIHIPHISMVQKKKKKALAVSRSSRPATAVFALAVMAGVLLGNAGLSMMTGAVATDQTLPWLRPNGVTTETSTSTSTSSSSVRSASASTASRSAQARPRAMRRNTVLTQTAQASSESTGVLCNILPFLCPRTVVVPPDLIPAAAPAASSEQAAAPSETAAPAPRPQPVVDTTAAYELLLRQLQQPLPVPVPAPVVVSSSPVTSALAALLPPTLVPPTLAEILAIDLRLSAELTGVSGSEAGTPCGDSLIPCTDENIVMPFIDGSVPDGFVEYNPDDYEVLPTDGGSSSSDDSTPEEDFMKWFYTQYLTGGGEGGDVTGDEGQSSSESSSQEPAASTYSGVPDVNEFSLAATVRAGAEGSISYTRGSAELFSLSMEDSVLSFSKTHPEKFVPLTASLDNEGTQHQVVATFDGGAVSLYIDGIRHTTAGRQMGNTPGFFQNFFASLLASISSVSEESALTVTGDAFQSVSMFPSALTADDVANMFNGAPVSASPVWTPETGTISGTEDTSMSEPAGDFGSDFSEGADDGFNWSEDGTTFNAAGDDPNENDGEDFNWSDGSTDDDNEDEGFNWSDDNTDDEDEDEGFNWSAGGDSGVNWSASGFSWSSGTASSSKTGIAVPATPQTF